MTTPPLRVTPSRPHPSAPPLVLVGASTRAAAWSAIRAGWRPLCADLFADQDLVDVADSVAVENYPGGLVDAITALTADHPTASCPRIYTGAMENHPDVLTALSAAGPLLGNPIEVLNLVRDPQWVAGVCRAASLPCPEVRTAHEVPDRDGRWMMRRRDSAGGSGVTEWNESAGPLGNDVLFQRRVPGHSAAALCLGNGSSACVLGITEQLVGKTWLNAPRWAWCGSIGPLVPRPPLADQIARLADVLAEQAGLMGLFGIDLVLEDEQTAWPIEINPRYAGSSEVIEMATGHSAIGRHLEMFGEPPIAPYCDPTGAIHGKAVLYARRDIRINELPRSGPSWQLADIPCHGSQVAEGRPLCTVLATAGTVAECREVLKQAARDLYRELADAE